MNAKATRQDSTFPEAPLLANGRWTDKSQNIAEIRVRSGTLHRTMNTRISQNFSYTFEKLCAKILEANGILDESDSLAYRDPDPPDLVGRDKETGETAVAAAKVYLSTKTRLDLFYDAISRRLRRTPRYSAATLPPTT